MAENPAATRRLVPIIAASSAGTLIEWYDFYLFGALSVVLSTHFFPKENPTAAFLSTLATFAAGFVVRPFGAVFFGRIGDIVGRKYTFLVTLLLMGGSTFLIGLVPGYEQIGLAAPAIVLVLRLLQGLALGGEYGGAATYVAEYAPDHRRGYITSYIQTTATLGLLASLGVIIACRLNMGEAAFNAWGWRVPFLLSIVLVIFSYFLRQRLHESPLFARMKAGGKGSPTPIRDSFGQWPNLRLVLIALFGATAGQGVVWYTGQFYALTFLQKSLNIEFVTASLIVAAALIAATPFFLIFGALSDRIGRKPIMLTGCLLAVLTYLPIYHHMAAIGDLARKGQPTSTRIVSTDTATAGDTRTDTVTTERIYACGTVATETVTTPTIAGTTGKPTGKLSVRPPLAGAAMLSLLIFIQVLYVTMVYGPIAAFLVELFPTRIRYTSMSLPYHIGNGIFGGLTPFIATAMAALAVARPDAWYSRLAGGPMFVGLLYPMAVAAITVIIGLLLVRERRGVKLDDDL